MNFIGWICRNVLHFAAQKHRSSSRICASIIGMIRHYRHMDASSLSQQIDLDLPDHVMDRLERMSATTGQSVPDLASTLLLEALAADRQQSA